jgi:hypothetical protein
MYSNFLLLRHRIDLLIPAALPEQQCYHCYFLLLFKYSNMLCFTIKTFFNLFLLLFFLILNNTLINILISLNTFFYAFLFPTLSGCILHLLNEFAPLYLIAGKFRKLRLHKLRRFIPKYEQSQIFFNA